MIERDIGLRTFIESGVALDAVVSRDLLCSIFERGGALHDGAAIIQGDRVAAAACFLPLTTNPVMLRRLGTRHRAAIGVTEESDALAIVVSEETGQIAIASRGELEPDVSMERLQERLTRHTTGKADIANPRPASRAGSRRSPRAMGIAKNLGWKLASLVLAVLLWLAFSSAPEVVTTHTAPIVYQQSDHGWMVTGNSPETRAPGIARTCGALDGCQPCRDRGPFDLADVEGPGRRTFTISESNLNLPPGVTFLRAVPRSCGCAWRGLRPRMCRWRSDSRGARRRVSTGGARACPRNN